MDYVEINAHIDKVALKYEYDNELTEALKKCIPAMIEGKTEEEIQLLMDTLDRVQIYTFEKQPTQEKIDSIVNQKINGRNTHVKTVYHDRRAYDESDSPGAYVSEPVFDENMNIVDRIGFIYLTNLNTHSKTAEFYGSRINLSHLIHELEHAWAAQKGEYIQEENGNFIKNVGTYRESYSVDKNTHLVNGEGIKGLYIEEALNTIEEEETLYRMFEVDTFWKIPGYVRSEYQGLITDLMRHYIKKLGRDVFRNLRITKKEVDIKQLQALFNGTDYMKGMQTEEHFTEKKKTS